jgi:hypothetical protein
MFHTLQGASRALLPTNSVFPLGFLITVLYAFLISSVLVPDPSHHIIGLAIVV